MTEKEAYQKGYNDALKDVMQSVQEFYKDEARPNGNMSDEEKAEAMTMGLYICDPEKNSECHKGSSCQEVCFLTSDPRFKLRGIAQYNADLTKQITNEVVKDWDEILRGAIDVDNMHRRMDKMKKVLKKGEHKDE